MREDGLIPAEPARCAGIGLRAPLIEAVLGGRPPVSFLEVHAENHMGDGRAFETLDRVRRDNAISIHGVGLSLGGAARPDPIHLSRFADLVQRIEPVLVSEHLTWCRDGDIYLNDLLPIPYTDESLDLVARNVDIVQQAIGRRILMENPSHYLAFTEIAARETDFIADLCRRTGCGLLLDVNNVVVSATNLGFDAAAWIDALPLGLVGEIHLAGHEAEDGLLIDTHGGPVSPEVWALYAHAINRFGPQPTLIERDRNIPPLVELVAEAHNADLIAFQARGDHARAA
jgi:uncharacterized protein (UPF0276 family)